MKPLGLLLAAGFCLLIPSTSKAQTTGRVECARNDGYVYLYSSMATMEVRTTLQCGEIVQISSRSDACFSVRTSKGEVGYIPSTNIVVLKDQPGPNHPQAGATPPARERMSYDERPPAPLAPVNAAPGFALLNNTQVRVRLLKALSSASAHPGDAVEFEVLEDVLVDGVTVIAKGSKATGKVVEAEAKKRFGHDGKVSFNVNSVRLADNESAPVRCFYESLGSSHSSSNSVVPLASGKDATIPEGTEFTARVDGDVRLKREAFLAAKDAPAPPTPTATTH